ncbi:hypothetical protein [Bradyrhizobium lablabi]|nr:hypothetical protein [Bradyrhizobium lablabi]MBR0693117.1 hypothetical protein [Bradyrhizobium lablabi]
MDHVVFKGFEPIPVSNDGDSVVLHLPGGATVELVGLHFHDLQNGDIVFA